MPEAEDTVVKGPGVKSTLRWALFHLLRVSAPIHGRGAAGARPGAGWGSVLVFHRLSRSVRDGITVSPESFRSILGTIKRHYRVIPYGELVQKVVRRESFDGLEVAITFDDGYRDNYEHAVPALLEFGLSACFFVTVGYIGTERQFPWDADQGAPSPLMDWRQLREIVDAGFEVGCHTWSHPNLASAPIESANRELVTAKATLEDRLGVAVGDFAYPFGGAGDIRREWIEAIKAAGFRSNCSAHGGLVTAATDPYAIPRLGASHQATLTDLRIDIENTW